MFFALLTIGKYGRKCDQEPCYQCRHGSSVIANQMIFLHSLLARAQVGGLWHSRGRYSGWWLIPRCWNAKPE